MTSDLSSARPMARPHVAESFAMKDERAPRARRLALRSHAPPTYSRVRDVRAACCAYAMRAHALHVDMYYLQVARPHAGAGGAPLSSRSARPVGRCELVNRSQHVCTCPENNPSLIYFLRKACRICAYTGLQSMHARTNEESHAQPQVRARCTAATTGASDGTPRRDARIPHATS